MNNGLMIDAVFALVLILSVVFGAKRGLFRSFMALAAIVLALIGASLLTDALTEPVTDMLMPRLEKSVEEWFDTESQTPQGDVPQIEGETPAESDASGETPNGDAAQDAAWKARTDWDIALCGELIRTNGGTSGNGQGAVQRVQNKSFNALDQAPADGYTTDTDDIVIRR